ncbi:MAG: hypothetical protein ACTHJ0_07830 [Flavipsychrobacter sp.]
MNEKNDILSELEQMGSTLANMSRKMPYEVPGDYFAGLTASIIQHTQFLQQDEPVLNISKAPVQDIPADYFNALPDRLLLAARLSDLPQAMPHTVPAGYFDTLSQQVLTKTRKVKPGRIVAFSARLRWAAAALLVIGMGIGSYEFLHTRSNRPEVALSKVPQAKLQEYVKQNIDDFDAEMIVSNLQSADVHNVQTSAKQLDEQEIIQYLDETGWDADVDSKANNKVD